ncbi:hypothetical protein K469DRAFT_689639 [Zopfia rhizophila CBS 207.26]|uniref:Uncharacterized protein n=1 Tax=Zopfia rhizophila CBS 207.26 TaxID=1314779 RepID=A0A6A6E159_9PEZI|nr:hypothetical protein K469DRAFT_689639 [Zopfia rhizophila CBS 207.26]
MPHQDQKSGWHGASPQQRANIFPKLDNNDRLEVVQGLSSTEGGEILDEMKSSEAQLSFLTCMKFDRGISTLANATKGTRGAIVEAVTLPSLQEIINHGIEEYLSEEVPTSAEAIVQELKNPGPKNSGRKPAKIIAFTDVGRDIDDAALLVVLAYLHKIKVVEVLLVVTNVKPTESRAKAAKFIFEKMGAPDVPVARGSDGTDEDVNLHHYEFEGVSEPQGTILNGESAIVEKLEALKKNEERCNMIVVTSLRDLSELIKRHESLVETTVSSFFFQGAWEADHEHVKTLVPDMAAVNNSYDRDATTHVYEWLRRGNISTYTATRFSAVKATISSQVFREAAERGHPAARYVYHAFGEQERKYYDDAANPERRFRPHIDKGWYANQHPRWREARGDALPETFEDIQPFVGMTLYDVVAGLLCPLQEYNFVKHIYQPHEQKILIGGKKVDHYVIGRPGDGAGKTIPDVNHELLSNVIVQLLQEGLSEIETV